MSYLRSAGLAEHDCHHVKAERAVLYIMRGQKITSGPQQPHFFGMGNGIFGRAKTFVSFGPDLDKNDGAVGIDHDQVDFASLAGKIASELSKAFFL